LFGGDPSTLKVSRGGSEPPLTGFGNDRELRKGEHLASSDPYPGDLVGDFAALINIPKFSSRFLN
jgi:hypothetical protein